MSVEMMRTTLLWCTALNYGMLVLWFVIYLTAREQLYALWRSWYRLSNEQFDILNFAGMAFYKIGIFLFNLAPYVALCLAA